ncbi:MAG: hypothetical protein HOM68_23590 [Gemmatimonadetes bacterium]|jgi:HPt (histidine-containing phosphotransfer) domain-containing protein|nr:hypothetical protein [Gemmatimonadota bacterium]MBT4610718.1 hypothetical protein [Gemmatimonadota bacterium]MBT5059549.1 hypothetical protein [Gemmatimonadota bacterium]MBT5146277.1 hypothetical protein [Gemmatimonadota bacterium]MBT5591200.1 hypothetical protein [Gemmatimonadota bacterium]
MNDHVPKPIDPEALFKTMLKWIPAGERETVAVDSLYSSKTSDPAGSADASDSISALSSIDGLDVGDGLRRVMGKRDLYERLVRGFATGVESRAVKSVQAQLSQGEREAAERTAHSLKGVAGTIGAVELQRRSQALESGIQRGSEITTLLAPAEEELTRLVTAIRGALGLEAAQEQEEAELETELEPELDLGAVKRLPILVESLETEIEVVTELSSTLTINEIEDFAERMGTLGKEHGYTALVSWSARLAKSADQFDMDGMLHELHEYPTLIESVRKLDDS